MPRTAAHRGAKTPAKACALTSLDSAKLALRTAIEQRCRDPRALHIGPLSSIAEYFLIASGTSQRHVQGVVDKIKKALAAEGSSALSVSGYDNGEWVLVDYGDLVVHVFYEPIRQYYNLDQLWSDAACVDVDADLEAQLRLLRTGMY